jgi:hypothetical protein
MRLLAAIAVLSLSGCAYFQPAADRVGIAVKEYCLQPLETRLVVRASVNKAAAPNAVLITCAGDPK